MRPAISRFVGSGRRHTPCGGCVKRSGHGKSNKLRFCWGVLEVDTGSTPPLTPFCKNHKGGCGSAAHQHGLAVPISAERCARVHDRSAPIGCFPTASMYRPVVLCILRRFCVDLDTAHAGRSSCHARGGSAIRGRRRRARPLRKQEKRPPPPRQTLQTRHRLRLMMLVLPPPTRARKSLTPDAAERPPRRSSGSRRHSVHCTRPSRCATTPSITSAQGTIRCTRY